MYLKIQNRLSSWICQFGLLLIYYQQPTYNNNNKNCNGKKEKKVNELHLQYLHCLILMLKISCVAIFQIINELYFAQFLLDVSSFCSCIFLNSNAKQGTNVVYFLCIICGVLEWCAPYDGIINNPDVQKVIIIYIHLYAS